MGTRLVVESSALEQFSRMVRYPRKQRKLSPSKFSVVLIKEHHKTQ